MAYSIRLIEDRLAPSAGYGAALPALNRVLYVDVGRVSTSEGVVDTGTARVVVDCDGLRAGADGALVLRFELCRQPPPGTGGGRVMLEHAIRVDPRAAWLIRCDRVDFQPNGVAQPHRHRGGGIRRLLRGMLQVTVGDGASRLMRPGDVWFESGREPVLAEAGPEPTSFVRVSILPLEIRGKSSIMYVDPADAERSRPRTYTVFVDEPIALGRDATAASRR